MNSNLMSPVKSRSRIDIVPSLDAMIPILRSLFEDERKVREFYEKTSSSFLENPKYPEILDFQRQQMTDSLNLIKEKLLTFLTFPPQHLRHLGKLEAFHRGAPYDESVFIMTKYQEGKSEIDAGLQRVINAVIKSLSDCGFYPRMASDYAYHPLIWDNIELYLLGCCKGVAIIEDRYKPEFNPNVAMEWGWMRGMGKDVLFLVEEEFKHFRADLSGLIEYRFSWDEPEGDIKQAIEKWLKRKEP
jgi:hypothetical protein